ncbi:hypothetical protein Z517_06826 [Fonsecaea pedrosoi CBS 271.37]|uniref:FAD-binding domain-containing protein n=1 Tax=Fonsecaea pedrosoi CBS 271.37 TaxID=1442368 RepID=A0A0D2DQV7_9EURO|nr:uncharacterized protein Z517_06826 [Fonsecaea pedrosoi CBS 271.37]KIW80211.1 hypothetical protein Z517_06826 [Fonsecaea pedrosoi CBS 271.37]
MSSKVEVIIVGGGVSGLTFSHCLRKAGLSYVVLEKGSEICFHGGASIGLMPHGLRILDQLGLCDQILSLTVPVATSTSRLSNGKKFRHSYLLAELEKRHGYPTTFFEREELLQVLYRNIPDKQNVKTSQQVTGIELGDNQVTVVTRQGQTWQAPIVVGADGIHSFVRQAIWKEIEQKNKGASLNQSQSIMADYYCIFGVSVYKSDDPEFGEGSGHANFDHERSTVVVNSSRNKHFWFLILKFDKRQKYPNIPRFGDKDMEKTATENQDLMVTEHTSFAHLWRLRTKCAMVPLEEVVFDVWYANRMVLLGDSAHKVTPNAGQGGNSAIESAAVLANRLHKAKQTYGNLAAMHTTSITNLFQQYYSDRNGVKEMSQTSGFVTRLHAQDSRMLKVIGRHIFPFLGDNFDLNAMSNYMIGAPTLDFVEVKTKPASIPWEGWTIPSPTSSSKEGGPSALGTLTTLAILGLFLGSWTYARKEAELSAIPRLNSSILSTADNPSPSTILPSLVSEEPQPWADLAILLNTLPMAAIIASESFRVKNLSLVSAM